MAPSIEIRRFDEPDQVLDMAPRGRIAILKLADGTAGMHAVFEPGWRWQVDEKPLLGNPESCPMRHTGYCIRGSLVVVMVASGETTTITAGDFFEIPPGHDGWLEGNERAELILFAPPEHAKS